MPQLKLLLKPLPELTSWGIYGVDRNRLPERMLFLHPEAAASLLLMMSKGFSLRLSDMFRSAEASLAAVQAKRGAQPPGYSGHNYGLSIDIDISGTLKKLRLETKKKLDEFLLFCGWYCHRKDHRLDFEAWHYNYGLQPFLREELGERTTAPTLDRKISRLYGSYFTYGAREAQEKLASLGLYQGKIDGDVGPLSREAIRAFQRAWKLDTHKLAKAEYGKLEKRTLRTLAYVTAKKELV